MTICSWTDRLAGMTPTIGEDMFCQVSDSHQRMTLQSRSTKATLTYDWVVWYTDNLPGILPFDSCRCPVFILLTYDALMAGGLLSVSQDSKASHHASVLAALWQQFNGASVILPSRPTLTFPAFSPQPRNLIWFLVTLWIGLSLVSQQVRTQRQATTSSNRETLTFVCRRDRLGLLEYFNPDIDNAAPSITVL